MMLVIRFLRFTALRFVMFYHNAFFKKFSQLNLSRLFHCSVIKELFLFAALSDNFYIILLIYTVVKRSFEKK